MMSRGRARDRELGPKRVKSLRMGLSGTGDSGWWHLLESLRWPGLRMYVVFVY